MKENVTELVFILDCSGSMRRMTREAIGGFNDFIARQKQEPGRCLVSAVLFNNSTEVLYDRVPLDEVPPMTEQDYRPGGSTALLDAVGGSIRHIGRLHRRLRDEAPERTVFVIITDGHENASCIWSRDEVKRRIERNEAKFGWRFLFLGANMDAVAEAGRIGIVQQRARSYMPGGRGLGQAYDAADKAVKSMRRGGEVDEDWGKDLEQDGK